MSEEDIKIQQEWEFEIINPVNNAAFVYSNFFDTSLIAGVEIKIISAILNPEGLIVILSKTPNTPANATIKIQSTGFNSFGHINYQKHVNRWIDSCTLKFDFNMNGKTAYNKNTEVYAKYQCDITWHGYDESERNVIHGSLLEHILTASDFSDMIIVIGEKEIPVHKTILAANSPVFLAMFKTDMSESLNKQIVVTDTEVDIMEKVINFMYTGVIHPAPDIDALISILAVADKYEIMTLQKLCEQKLSEKIRIENVLEILDRISLYRVPRLRQIITSFMVKNKSTIVGLEGFADLHNRKPKLLFNFIRNSIAPH
ncbi:hypothetical protein PV328_010457 [Microctonus aethiopoides]|uniref:BTB domain-containing protein n=1 Tax=Microctonus aethiopoides TaxID=144406 RepID=A0AA39FI82_9HYME|nr:hypothetical protein PV328_010457 [Microctonus aethiopoides]